MKNSNLTLLLLLSAMLPITSVYSQNAEKQRLKANLEEAFSKKEPKASAAAPQTADGILYYVQVLSAVKPIEGTGEKALRDFTDLKSYREDRYVKYYTGRNGLQKRKGTYEIGTCQRIPHGIRDSI